MLVAPRSNEGSSLAWSGPVMTACISINRKPRLTATGTRRKARGRHSSPALASSSDSHVLIVVGCRDGQACSERPPLGPGHRTCAVCCKGARVWCCGRLPRAVHWCHLLGTALHPAPSACAIIHSPTRPHAFLSTRPQEHPDLYPLIQRRFKEEGDVEAAQAGPATMSHSWRNASC